MAVAGRKEKLRMQEAWNNSHAGMKLHTYFGKAECSMSFVKRSDKETLSNTRRACSGSLRRRCCHRRAS